MTINEQIMEEAAALEAELIEYRRYLHANAGVGFEIESTYEYVWNRLVSFGCQPVKCGRMGIYADIAPDDYGKDGEHQNKMFMLRADMDGLQIDEETDLEFKCTTGNMHACGHDMHTAMLLGASRILMNHRQELKGSVRLMFQAAEEIFQGAQDMIQHGVLTGARGEKPDGAMMIHVMAGMPFKTGTVVVSSPGVSAPAADYFQIEVRGTGCHGSMPNTGVDPITAAAHIITGLQEINARELAMEDKAVLTIGSINGGNAANAIPDKVIMKGSIRTFDENVRAHIKLRLETISRCVSEAYRAEAEVTYGSGCPCLVNDQSLSGELDGYMKELLGENMVFTSDYLKELSSKDSNGGTKSAGSEDFAYISQEVPSIMMAMVAGRGEDGFIYPQHHPKATFDEAALTAGCAAYAYTALRWLSDHQ